MLGDASTVWFGRQTIYIMLLFHYLDTLPNTDASDSSLWMRRMHSAITGLQSITLILEQTFMLSACGIVLVTITSSIASHACSSFAALPESIPCVATTVMRAALCCFSNIAAWTAHNTTAIMHTHVHAHKSTQCKPCKYR